MAADILICPIIIFALIILFCGIIISIYFREKKRNKYYIFSIIVTIIIVLAIIGGLFFEILKYNSRPDKYIFKLTIEGKDTDSTNNTYFTLIIDDEVESVFINFFQSGSVRKWDVKEGKTYQFSITSENFRFFDSNTSINGSIMVKDNNLKIEISNYNEEYIQILEKRDNKQRFELNGIDGSIMFSISYAYTVD